MPKTNLGNALSIGADSLSVPKVNFKVNQYAVLFSSIASEIRARGTVKADPSQEAKLRERGLLDDEWSRRINEFAKANKADFVSSKLFSKVSLLETLEPFAGKIGTSEFESKARNNCGVYNGYIFDTLNTLYSQIYRQKQTRYGENNIRG